jgi:hypothetical protein
MMEPLEPLELLHRGLLAELRAWMRDQEEAGRPTRISVLEAAVMMTGVALGMARTTGNTEAYVRLVAPLFAKHCPEQVSIIHPGDGKPRTDH